MGPADRRRRQRPLRRQRGGGRRARVVRQGPAAGVRLKPTRDLDLIVADSDRLVEHLVPPPRPGDGICSTCRTWSDTGEDVCSNCVETQEALGAPALPINVASLYSKPSELREWLARYKGEPDGSEPADPACLPPVRALAGRFLLEHGEEIAARAGGVDGLVVVPSTDRPPPHPLATVLSSLGLDVPVLPALVRTRAELRFRYPNPHGYAPVGALDPAMRLLVVDDVYTTGARANSAAAALRAAGTRVAGVLVLARRVNPGWQPAAAEFWTRQAAMTFDWRQSPVLAPSGASA